MFLKIFSVRIVIAFLLLLHHFNKDKLDKLCDSLVQMQYLYICVKIKLQCESQSLIVTWDVNYSTNKVIKKVRKRLQYNFLIIYQELY